MAPSFLHELLDEARDDEALVAGDRSVLLDLDFVADLVLVGLVVRLVAGARADVLAVERVAARRDALDHDGLHHLRLDDLAGHLAAEAVTLAGRGERTRALRRGHGGGRRGGGLLLLALLRGCHGYFASFLDAFFGLDVFAVFAAPDAAFAFADIFFL